MTTMTANSPLGHPTDPARPGLSPDDADALLAIDAALLAPSPEWVVFLRETLANWLVEQRSPAGVMDDAKAHWLMVRIDEDGVVTTPSALAVLRQCCVQARTVPASLLAYLRTQEQRLRYGMPTERRLREG